MRIFSLMCVLIVVVLNFVPCADLHNDEVVQTSVSASAPESHQGHADEDYCTPFCQCNCCGSHVITILPYHVAETQIILGKGSLFYTTEHCPNVGQSIWQPPKLTS